MLFKMHYLHNNIFSRLIFRQKNTLSNNDSVFHLALLRLTRLSSRDGYPPVNVHPLGNPKGSHVQ